MRDTARSCRHKWLPESRPTENCVAVSRTIVPFAEPDTTTTLESTYSLRAASLAQSWRIYGMKIARRLAPMKIARRPSAMDSPTYPFGYCEAAQFSNQQGLASFSTNASRWKQERRKPGCGRHWAWHQACIYQCITASAGNNNEPWSGCKPLQPRFPTGTPKEEL